MAYRLRLIAEIEYGSFVEYMKAQRKLEQIMRDRGWAPVRTLVPVAGANNQVIVEIEYPDLATYERENGAFYADQEAFGAYRDGARYVVQGTARTELLEDVPDAF